jgi:hypothetical protein
MMSVVENSAALLPTRFQNRPKLPCMMPPSENSTRMMKVGLRLGRVTCQIRCHAEAPSTVAASYMLRSMPMMAAK